MQRNRLIQTRPIFEDKKYTDIDPKTEVEYRLASSKNHLPFILIKICEISFLYNISNAFYSLVIDCPDFDSVFSIQFQTVLM